jgi:hypothetical protein
VVALRPALAVSGERALGLVRAERRTGENLGDAEDERRHERERGGEDDEAKRPRHSREG